ncbi:hypothetical protein [Palleronia rufa]|uniref:hypothetical protein n=1 Tax=Palleronia rufa TaxID=1530186 RepID=UPI001268A8E7|nr:hypothetical protein [Palleronia rufa]
MREKTDQPVLPGAPALGADVADLIRIAARHTLLPHPDVVAKMNGAMFPSVRGPMKDRLRVIRHGTSDVLVDDNTTPRWALFWSHGIRATHSAKGWTVAHLWPGATVRDPRYYTALGNLALIAEPLAALSDTSGPFADYLRFHAKAVYGFVPSGAPIPAEPPGYGAIAWRYLDPIPDPRAFLRGQMLRLANQRVERLRPLMWPAQ